MVRRGEEIIKHVKVNNIYSFQRHIIKCPRNSSKVKHIASKLVNGVKTNQQTEVLTRNCRSHGIDQTKICHSVKKQRSKPMQLVSRLIAKNQMILTVNGRKTLVNKMNDVSVDADDETHSHRRCFFDSS